MGSQRLVDAVKANESVAPESDVCTDSIVVSFFETHPEYNQLGFAQCKAERMLAQKARGSWWTNQMVSVNEVTLSWYACIYRLFALSARSLEADHHGCFRRFDIDADNEPSSKSAGSVSLADITAVNWPVHGEHHEGRPRINCFSVEAGGKEHVFATPSKAWCVARFSSLLISAPVLPARIELNIA